MRILRKGLSFRAATTQGTCFSIEAPCFHYQSPICSICMYKYVVYQCMHEWNYGLMYLCIYGMYRCLIVRTHVCVCVCVCACMHACMHRCMDAWIHGCMSTEIYTQTLFYLILPAQENTKTQAPRRLLISFGNTSFKPWQDQTKAIPVAGCSLPIEGEVTKEKDIFKIRISYESCHIEETLRTVA